VVGEVKTARKTARGVLGLQEESRDEVGELVGEPSAHEIPVTSRRSYPIAQIDLQMADPKACSVHFETLCLPM
jgi:hypothetical protein